ncbi:hypothetical protein HBB16_21490 [Pseudonocardia sp. MCCB 268]|nr:hypothetical protein [Pseudonocardia cytotoxica]
MTSFEMSDEHREPAHRSVADVNRGPAAAEWTSARGDPLADPEAAKIELYNFETLASFSKTRPGPVQAPLVNEELLGRRRHRPRRFGTTSRWPASSASGTPEQMVISYPAVLRRR